MKVFVYRKEKPYVRLHIIENVREVMQDPGTNKIIIKSDVCTMEFDTRFVKTTTFQN